MLKQQIQALLLGRLGPIEDNGFRFVKTRQWFARGSGEPLQCLWLRITESHNHYTLSTAVSVRFDSVETIFHRTSGFDSRYHRGTATLDTALSELDPSYPHWQPVDTTDQIEGAALHILTGYAEIVEPFFNRFNRISDIERYVNAFPGTPVPGRSWPWFRAATGIICAHLVGNPAISSLAYTYQRLVAEADRGFYLPQSDRLLADLGVTPSAA